jgi:membrane associated rhomboid family serine protease
MTQFRPSRFEILPMVIKNLLIINVLVFLAQNTIGKEGGQFDMYRLFALHTWQSPWFKPWQFVTHMFMHGNLPHIFLNMMALWMFGSVLENVWGPKRFITFYMICGLGAALCHMLILYYEMQPIADVFKQMPPDQQEQLIDNPLFKLNGPTVGASGAVFGCLAAFGYLFPNTYIYWNLLIPVKAKWFVIGYAAVELFSGIRNSAGDNVAHFAHLGGALAGIILVYFWNRNNRKKFY